MGKAERVEKNHMIALIKMRGRIYERNVKTELSIDLSNLKNEIVSQAENAGWWRTLLAVANAEMREAERLMKKTRSVRMDAIGDRLEGGGERRSEDKIRRMVYADIIYNKSVKKYNQALESAEYIQQVVNSFSERGNMLIGLGADERKENIYAN